jgi:membrane protein DedA with SNARE-associated domain
MGSESFASKVFIFLIGLSGFQAYAIILAVLFACGLGIPIPEDITLFAAGFLAFKGRISLTGAILVGIIGVLVGDTFLYSIGRIFGRRVFTWPYFRRIFTASRIERAENRIQKRGKIICFTARFIPGLRAPIYLTSGVLRVPISVFLGMDALAASISVPVWVCLAYFLGDKIEMLFALAEKAKIAVFGSLIVLVILYLIFLKIQKSRQLRKL